MQVGGDPLAEVQHRVLAYVGQEPLEVASFNHLDVGYRVRQSYRIAAAAHLNLGVGL